MPRRPTPSRRRSRARRGRDFSGGLGAAGFGLHEAGHIVTSAAFGAHPRVRGVEPQPVPFFAIVHDPVTRRQEFVISSSGFWMQRASVGVDPLGASQRRQGARALPEGHARLQRGHVGRLWRRGVRPCGPAERDTRGMAISLGKDGVPEPVVGAHDRPGCARRLSYLRPDATWAKMEVARGSRSRVSRSLLRRVGN